MGDLCRLGPLREHMTNSRHEGTRIRRDIGSVGFRLWRRFGYCRTGYNYDHGNPSRTTDRDPYHHPGSCRTDTRSAIRAGSTIAHA